MGAKFLEGGVSQQRTWSAASKKSIEACLVVVVVADATVLRGGILEDNNGAAADVIVATREANRDGKGWTEYKQTPLAGGQAYFFCVTKSGEWSNLIRSCTG